MMQSQLMDVLLVSLESWMKLVQLATVSTRTAAENAQKMRKRTMMQLKDCVDEKSDIFSLTENNVGASSNTLDRTVTAIHDTMDVSFESVLFRTKLIICSAEVIMDPSPTEIKRAFKSIVDNILLVCDNVYDLESDLFPFIEREPTSLLPIAEVK